MSSQYYSATAYLGTGTHHDVEVTIPLVGPQGPAGDAGAGAVESVNGQTGVVVLAAADVGAAAASHTHAAADITSGTLNIGRIPTGTGSTQVALGNHTHTLSAITDAGTAAAQDANQDLGTSDQVTFQGVTVNGPPVNEIYPGEGVVNCGKLNLDTYAVDLGGGSTGDGFPSIVFGAINGGITLKGPEGDITTSKVINIPNASGTLALTSNLTKIYAVFTAEHNQPPATAFATLDTRNSIAVLDFDDATDESAVFVSIIPEAASLGSGLKIRLHWMATTATSGNVVWDVSLERMTTDLDSDDFGTIASGTAAANGTSGVLTVTEITLTTIDSVTAGDAFRLKVTRDANNASDTMTGDAELVAVEIRSAA